MAYSNSEVHRRTTQSPMLQCLDAPISKLPSPFLVRYPGASSSLRLAGLPVTIGLLCSQPSNTESVACTAAPESCSSTVGNVKTVRGSASSMANHSAGETSRAFWVPDLGRVPRFLSFQHSRVPSARLAGPTRFANGNQKVTATVVENPVQMELNRVDRDVQDLWPRRRTHNPNDYVDGFLAPLVTTDGSLPLVGGHLKRIGFVLGR